MRKRTLQASSRAKDETPPGVEHATVDTRAWDMRSIGITVIAAVAAVYGLRTMAPLFIPIVLSAIVFYTLDPLVRGMAKRGVPRGIGAALVLLFCVGVLAGGAYSLRGSLMTIIDDLPKVTQKVRASLRADRKGPPGPIEKVQKAASEIEKTAAEATGGAGGSPGAGAGPASSLDVSGTLRSGTLGLLALAGEATMILFLSYFLLAAGDLYKKRVVSIVEPLSSKKITVEILDDIGEQIQRFLITLVLTSVLVAATTWAALAFIGVKQAAVWGLAAGALNSIPYFGPLIVTFGLTAVGFAQFGNLAMAAYVGAVALVITSLEGWLVTPFLMGKAARMDEAAIFVGLLFWSWAWGVPGLFLAVPMMMILKTVCDRVEPLQPIGKLLGK